MDRSSFLFGPTRKASPLGPVFVVFFCKKNPNKRPFSGILDGHPLYLEGECGDMRCLFLAVGGNCGRSSHFCYLVQSSTLKSIAFIFTWCNFWPSVVLCVRDSKKGVGVGRFPTEKDGQAPKSRSFALGLIKSFSTRLVN